ncbi:MAG: hypothetical protein WDO56_32035 [Gammaproteobacteria bacterium]
MADAFRADAQALVTRVKQKSGETIDAVADIHAAVCLQGCCLICSGCR